MNTHQMLLAGMVSLAMAMSVAAADEAERLHEIFAEYHAWQLEEFPEFAMSRGDYSNADQIADNSLAAIEARHRTEQTFLNRLRNINRSVLTSDDQINYDLFELELTNSIDSHRFQRFLMPIGSRSGPHQRIPQMHERVRFSSVKDYQDYLSRLSLLPEALESTVELMQRGLDAGLTPPRVVLEGVPDQLNELVEGDALFELRTPFNEFPGHINEEARRRITQRFDVEILPALRQALESFRAFVVNEYIPSCRETIGASALPDGEAYYDFRLGVFTTTELTAREIHDIGLNEVARIRAEMMDVIRQTDFMRLNPEASAMEEDDLFDAFLEYLRTDERFYHKTPDDLLRGYRDICKRADAWLPKYFGHLPRTPYGVRAIPGFMAPTQTTAYYSRGSLANAEPGWFYANTYALNQRPKYEMIPLALHEAVPGHHLQISLAQEMDDMPEFRRFGGFTAFVEGWALYAERLGIEAGMYENPYDDFGRLLYEMWRATRLVVDTGIHAMEWSRTDAIEYMLANTALSKLNIENEVDRYISWPGQATAYKIGELKIRELREQAEHELGAEFDIRAFHDVVLGAGAIPLTVLEQRVHIWIGSQTEPVIDSIGD